MKFKIKSEIEEEEEEVVEVELRHECGEIVFRINGFGFLYLCIDGRYRIYDDCKAELVKNGKW